MAKGDRRKEREDFFTSHINNFERSSLAFEVEKLSNSYHLENITAKLTPNAGPSINSFYWDLIDNHARPIIQSQTDDITDHEEDRVDLYKMLSCIEYAHLRISPIVIFQDNLPIDYSNNNSKTLHLERIINGYLAFTAAYEFLRRWDGVYSEVFNRRGTIDFLQSVETVSKRSNAMTYLDEHVYVVTHSSRNPKLPLFSNANWWRLLCAFAVANK